MIHWAIVLSNSRLYTFAKPHKRCMAAISKPLKYRLALDAMVDMCQSGQGQVGANCVRSAIWNPNASDSKLSDQHSMNLLLGKLSSQERETLAKVMTQEVQLGVFEALKTLEQHEFAPFEDGYEGSPCEDFVGRLQGWMWPE